MRMSSWMMCWRKNLTDKILTVATRNFDHGFEKILKPENFDQQNFDRLPRNG